MASPVLATDAGVRPGAMNRGVTRPGFRRLRGAFLLALSCAVWGAGSPRQEPAPGTGDAPPGSLDTFRDQARDILRGVRDRDLTLEEARRRVERLRRDLVSFGETQGWAPRRRTLEITIQRPDRLGPNLTDDCPLFFEEALVRFCPLDLGGSEIWGNQVVVCGYACAPTREGDPGAAPGEGAAARP